MQKKLLIITIALYALLVLHGFLWGKVEPWNPDNMVGFSFMKKNALDLNPHFFHKPPFYSYFNFLFAEIPARVSRKLLGLHYEQTDELIFIFSRFLMAILYLLSGFLFYKVSRKIFPPPVSAVNVILYFSSAGLLVYSHYLTTDIPVTLMMLTTLLISFKIFETRKLGYYILAGLMTGLATATKYNGLAVGISIPMAHWLSAKNKSIFGLCFHPFLVISMLFVPLGFLLGNPYALLDWKTFHSDFVYNYIVTPAYTGMVTGNNFINFFIYLKELVGLPLFIFCVLGFSLYLKDRREYSTDTHRKLIICLSVFLLYYIKFGSFPRLEMRFVLPVVPIMLLFSGFVSSKIVQGKNKWLSFFLLAVCLFNYLSCFYVGKRFNDDPRNDALIWINENVPDKSTILQTSYVPTWDKYYPKKELDIERYPGISGRKKLFAEIFQDSEIIMSNLDRVEKADDAKFDDFILATKQLQFDFLILNSIYYKRFYREPFKTLYPKINDYFQELLSEKMGYQVVFQMQSKKNPEWVFPRKIDFLNNQITILQKAGK